MIMFEPPDRKQREPRRLEKNCTKNTLQIIGQKEDLKQVLEMNLKIIYAVMENC